MQSRPRKDWLALKPTSLSLINTLMDDSKGQVLRFLASAWIFQEVKPDVYANNRNSSIMVKGLSVKELHDAQVNSYLIRAFL